MKLASLENRLHKMLGKKEPLKPRSDVKVMTETIWIGRSQR